MEKSQLKTWQISYFAIGFRGGYYTFVYFVKANNQTIQQVELMAASKAMN
jgi:hypothetical protein